MKEAAQRMESPDPIHEIGVSVAANLASDLIKAGGAFLRDAISGDAEERALERAYGRAFASMLDAICPNMDALMAEHLKGLLEPFVIDPAMNQLLLGIALEGKDPTPRSIRQFFDNHRLDVSTLPVDWEDAIAVLTVELFAAMREEAKRPQSKAFNLFTVSTLDCVLRVVKRLEPMLENHQAWGSLPPIPHQIPPPPDDFVGRGEELNELLAQVRDRGTRIVGVFGAGGIGKTALVYRMAERLAKYCPDGQIMVEMKGTEARPLTTDEAMRYVIRTFAPDTRLQDGSNALRAIYNTTLHDKHLLLLLDNAADSEQVHELIPPASCRLIVTSRTRFALPGMYPKDLSVLAPDEAEALLLTIARRLDCACGDDDGRRACDVLAEMCGYLPLALRAAASTLAERPDLAPDVYITLLREKRMNLDAVDAALQASVELLPDDLRKRWLLLSVFPDTFDRRAAAAVWETDDDSAREALSELVKRSLLEFTGSQNARYHLLDLARDFASQCLPRDELAGAETRRAAHFLGTSSVPGGQAVWQREHQLLDDQAPRRLRHGAHEMGRAVSFYQQALEIARAIDDLPGVGANLTKMGHTYSALGEMGRAVSFYQQALEIAREVDDLPGVGASLTNLGRAYSAIGETDQAIWCYQQALEIAQNTGDRGAESDALSALGDACTRGDQSLA